jgi:hypothetical protein
MTNGRSLQELMALRTVKKQLDRRREAARTPAQQA